MANALAINLRALAASAASGSGSNVDINSDITDARASRTAARLLLEVTAISGAAASLLVTVETSPDGTSGWRVVDSFPAVTAPAETLRAFAQLDRFVRVVWTLTAAGAATFSVDGHAHQLFLDRADIGQSELRDKALTGVPAAVIANACIIASGEIETALAAYTPPILQIGESLRQAGVVVAAYQILKWRGFNPDGPDQLLVDDKKAADKFLKAVREGDIDPGVIDSDTGDTGGPGATFAVSSQAPRGW